jgi:MSHA biogenesis protein MshP
MCPDYLRISRMANTLACQRGFSIVSAIFLLVVLATLGALMVTFTTVQHTTVAQDVQGARAYQAARAGAEWGVYQIKKAGGPSCSASTNLPLGGTLSGFAVTVTCAATGPVTEEGVNVMFYTITSTATTQGTAVGAIDHIERQVLVTVEN